MARGGRSPGLATRRRPRHHPPLREDGQRHRPHGDDHPEGTGSSNPSHGLYVFVVCIDASWTGGGADGTLLVN